MRNLILISTLAVLAAPLAGFAEDAGGCPEALATGAALGKTVEEVETSLKAQSYEIRKSENEDGQIEVYFVGDKMMGEVYVAPETGLITKSSCKAE